MKKFYAIVLSAALLLMGTQAFAQMSLGAGYINATDLAKSGNNSTSTNTNGAYVGFHYNLNLVAGLGIAPGLYADFLIGKDNGSIATISYEAKTTEIDLNVPLNLTYTLPLNRDFSIFLYAGPVFQYGVYRKSTSSAKGSITGASSTSTYDYYKDGNFMPFNVYLGGGAGFQASNIQVILGYDHNLGNMLKSDDVKVGRSQIKIGVGLAF